MGVLYISSWLYLCQELVPMALVSTKVDPQTKRRLADAIIHSECDPVIALGKPRLPSISAEASQIQSLTLEEFVGPASGAIFRALDFDTQILATPMPWDQQQDYVRLASFVTNQRVTNDTQNAA